jgi:hypothetical protein
MHTLSWADIRIVCCWLNGLIICEDPFRVPAPIFLIIDVVDFDLFVHSCCPVWSIVAVTGSNHVGKGLQIWDIAVFFESDGLE